jgi:hypothetical protein
MAVAAGSGTVCDWGAVQAVSAIKMIVNGMILFIYTFFLVFLIWRYPSVYF